MRIISEICLCHVLCVMCTSYHMGIIMYKMYTCIYLHYLENICIYTCIGPYDINMLSISILPSKHNSIYLNHTYIHNITSNNEHVYLVYINNNNTSTTTTISIYFTTTTTTTSLLINSYPQYIDDYITQTHIIWYNYGMISISQQYDMIQQLCIYMNNTQIRIHTRRAYINTKARDTTNMISTHPFAPGSIYASCPSLFINPLLLSIISSCCCCCNSLSCCSRCACANRCIHIASSCCKS